MQQRAGSMACRAQSGPSTSAPAPSPVDEWVVDVLAPPPGLIQTASASASHAAEPDWCGPLLLSWAASRGQSLLAARACVEGVLAALLRGATFRELQVGIRLARLSASRVRTTAAASVDSMSSVSSLSSLDALDHDDDEEQEAQAQAAAQGFWGDAQAGEELVAWVAMVVLVARQLGVPQAQAAGGAGRADSESERFLSGMAGFVGQALGLYAGGYNLERLAALQAVVSQGAPQGGAQAVMQQYTRIAVMTAEVLVACGLATRPRPPPPRPGQPASDLDASTASRDGEEQEAASGLQLLPTGFTAAFTPGGAACCPLCKSGAAASSTPLPSNTRALAVRVLVAFMGSVLTGTPHCTSKFVEAVALAYARGVRAPELLAALRASDFEQSGGVVPLGMAGAISAAAAGRAGGQGGAGTTEMGEDGPITTPPPTPAASLPGDASGEGEQGAGAASSDAPDAESGAVPPMRPADVTRALLSSWISTV
eukprot:CAMPEP_0202879426 /NCGR_PEP_ID=MMETSP1391-20130828/33579_1 /ASSEMBLY_ACC=CAM_ASM_000867 /TAXON_ID=1034604 /ORGANISM="Chlamydomonas leiostraca, Strain SAG 11-49" /LENGTH=482 /DNA_ID=CAMNT_0049561765 /DNA_START=63 /DNA_END=1508 /DNA_ORIENTATION=+